MTRALRGLCLAAALGGLAACAGGEGGSTLIPQVPVSSATPEGQAYYGCDQEAVARLEHAQPTFDLVWDRERLRRDCLARGGPQPRAPSEEPAATPAPPPEPVSIQPAEEQVEPRPARRTRPARPGRAGPASATETESRPATPRATGPRGAQPPSAAPTIPPTARTTTPDIVAPR
jgi:hypothetical protein